MSQVELESSQPCLELATRQTDRQSSPYEEAPVDEYDRLKVKTDTKYKYKTKIFIPSYSALV